MKIVNPAENIDLAVHFNNPVMVGRGDHLMRVYGLGTDRETGEIVLLAQPPAKYDFRDYDTKIVPLIKNEPFF